MNMDKVSTRTLHGHNELKFTTMPGAIPFTFGTKKWTVTLEVATGDIEDVRCFAVTIQFSPPNTFLN